MRFNAEQYFDAALERREQARHLHNKGEGYVLAVYVAGVAVECMLRAFKMRRDPTFDERHDLLLLFKASGMSDLAADREKRPNGRDERALRQALNEIYRIWSNDCRYASEQRMRADLKSRGLHRGRKGDVLKDSSRQALLATETFISIGVKLW